MTDRVRYWPVLVALVGIPLLAAALIPLRGHVENTNIALVLVVGWWRSGCRPIGWPQQAALFGSTSSLCR
jgi:hypothetical protein